MDITRAGYNPADNPDHRIEATVAPERAPISAPPGMRGVDPQDMMVGPGGKAEPVAGRMGDRPHFIRNVDGVELCGQDGKPWPCEWALALEAQLVALPTTPQGWPSAVADIERAAADAAGISVEEFRARIEAHRRRYE